VNLHDFAEPTNAANGRFPTFNSMKSVLSFLFLVGFAQLCYAQCTVKVGDDIHVCQTWDATSSPTIGLGDALIVTNATPPLTYEWSMEPIELLFNLTFYASDFVDDITLENPTMQGFWEDSLIFFLKVEDVNEQVCYDTIIVSASMFATQLADVTHYINVGDSVQLWGPNTSSNYPTDSVLWFPTVGLDNPRAFAPMASPSTNQFYGCTVWDSQGCMQPGSPFITVYVSAVGIDEASQASLVSVYSNQHALVLKVAENVVPYSFQLWDAQGKLTLEKQITQSLEYISTQELKTGVYLYSIKGRNGETESGKLPIR